MNTTLRTTSAAETRAAGRALGAKLLPGALVTLTGELGAGKTTFAQGVAEALGIFEVPSPTYVLIIEHPAPVPLLHLDAYRLEGACFDVIRDAGVDELFARTDAVKLVEWPIFVTDWMPVPDYAIDITHDGEEGRIIHIRANDKIG